MWLEAAKSGYEMSEWSQMQFFLLKGCDIFILPQNTNAHLHSKLHKGQ